MEASEKPEPTILFILGGGGDLTWRMLVPALCDLHADKWLPEKFAVIGCDQKNMQDDGYREHLKDGVKRFCHSFKSSESSWKDVLGRTSYLNISFDEAEGFSEMAKRSADIEKQLDAKANKIFYLAVPPFLIERIISGLEEARLNQPRERTRIVVEKPFGRDLASAKSLNRMIQKVFTERQIFRIDHYLGKETVQNILAFRFANSLFEPIWDRRYIDHVQITVAESLGVEHRGGYYDNAGALRDMIQNHLLQILSFIAMEPPVSFDPDEIRYKKLDVLRAIRPIPQNSVHLFAARGQYSAGWMQGKHVKGYREEEGVRDDSLTETYAALKLFIDNWRWQDVPFYLRSGKRIAARLSVISIHFRPVPHQTFPATALGEMQPNRLVITIQPDEKITLRFLVRRPVLGMSLSPADMVFSYRETFKSYPPEAYETLLLDILKGDATLFKRAEQVEMAWLVITPVLEFWENNPPPDFPNYAAGTWGPESAEVIIAQDGRRWSTPMLTQY
jgi:glucose-6-phosphate 1-dehydrogenase